MTRLVQIKKSSFRRVALVEEPNLRLLDSCSSIYKLAQIAIASGMNLSELVERRTGHQILEYDSVYGGRSEWRLLPAIDHPEEPARCLISGTGLTHLGSARDRQSMHTDITDDMTDSMKMFRLGVEGGRPPRGTIGVPPEWFYKGTGGTLRAHGDLLDIPGYAEDGGEEAEIAGAYLIGPGGLPYRVGMAVGNEFSDHQFEKKNYLNLAGSKLRTCALGPELVLGAPFDSIEVTVVIARQGTIHWSRTFRTGESEMCHSLENIEHHHFKYENHRRPGDVHIHFFGTDCLSFADNIRLQDRDVVEINAAGYGRALQNRVRVAQSKARPVKVAPLV